MSNLEFVCSDGHEFTAPLPPKHCPSCVKGKPCEGAVQPKPRRR